ncbi:transmembrane secretion effector [Micromonospora violae]|uniref:Transmembrane secretion effector n=1 Tax=Micromonospora violae TaxID=1278207 RepID=A0A4Q7UL89_9ACTN|nr:MFS transporter [Micromonospora violae]RZT82235.1 transmembrane secretion effector [Micromonospora violae]
MTRAAESQRRDESTSSAFVRIWVAQTLSNLGDTIFLSSVIWAATVLYGSDFGTIGVGLALFLPTALLLPFGGVLVDRYPRQRLLFGTDVIRALLTLALGVVLSYVEPAAAILLFTVAAVRVAGVLFMPAMHALLGEVARSDAMLLKLDSWMLASRMLAGIVGPLISGVVITSGLGMALIINGATFVVSCIALYLSRDLLSRPKPPARRSAGVLAAAKEGAATALHDPIFRRLAPTLPVIDLVGSGLTLLLPTLLMSRSESHASSYGLLISAWAVGRFGGLLLFRIRLLSERRGFLLATNCVLQGVVVCAISLTPGLILSAALFVLLGLPSGGASVCVNAYIQTEIPNELRGRVFSLLQSLVAVAMPLGPLVGGALAAWGRPSTAVFLLGGLLTAVGIPALLSPRVWNWKAPARAA